MVEVPDWRLQRLTELVHPKKTVPTTFEFTDIASKGEGLGINWLSLCYLSQILMLSRN